MPILQPGPGSLDVNFRPGNDVTFVMVWPESIDGRTFTAMLGEIELDATVDDTDLTIQLDSANSIQVRTATRWHLFENGQSLVTGIWDPTDDGTETPGDEVTVVVEDITVTVQVAGVPGPQGPPGGGGGSGDVATDTIWNAAGDLAVGTGADTAARLPIGADDQFLVAGASTLEYRTIVDADIPATIARDAETTAAVAAEAATRAAADSALDTRLDTIEGLGSLATDAELAAEAATRAAADSALDGRLDTIEALGDLATQAELDAVSGTIPSTEAIQDIVGAMVSGGTETGIAVTYDDTNARLDFVAEVTQAELDGKANTSHTHTTSELTDFAEGVSDQVGTMVTGNTETGITVTYQDADNTLDFVLSDEYLQDVVGAMVSGGTETGIAVTYDDTNGRLDFVAEVTQAELDGKANVSHTHTTADITDFDDAVKELVEGDRLSITVDEGLDTATFDVVLSQGVTGGDTLTGGDASGDDLTLASTSHATRGTINIRDQINLLSEDKTHTDTTAGYHIFDIPTSRTITLNDTGGGLNEGNAFKVMSVAPTIVYEANAYLFGAMAMFENTAIIKNAAAEARTMAAMFFTSNAVKLRADGAAVTAADFTSYRDHITYERINSGTIAGSGTSFESRMNVEAGATVALRTGFNFVAPTVNGTLTDQRAINIPALSVGDGIFNAATLKQSGLATFGATTAATWAMHLRGGNAATNALGFDTSTTGPTAPASSAGYALSMYSGSGGTNKYFLITYNDAGTTRYKYLQLNGTGTTWAQGTSLPT